eukprot:7447823-Alexandrium_andersonii.AAC.1
MAKHAAAGALVLLVENACELGLGGITYRSEYLDYRVWCKKHNISPCSYVWTDKLVSREARTSFPEFASAVKAAHMRGICFFIADR